MFVVVDGPNGAGKSTLVRALVDRLAELGRTPISLSAPSRSPLGLMARGAEEDMAGWPLAALVVADRYLQLRDDVEPALSSGHDVVLDRYVASTLALQRLDGLDLAPLWAMNVAVRRPDLMVLLECDVSVIRQRLTEREQLSRFERGDRGAERESQLFAEAADHLGQQGWRILRINSDYVTPEESARQALALVLS